MSRYYGMSIKVEGVPKNKMDHISAVMEDEWGIEDPGDLSNKGVFTAQGNNSLYGGESEEEFVERLSQAVCAALGKFAKVTVDATYLEDMPCETHVAGKEQYKSWMKKRKK